MGNDGQSIIVLNYGRVAHRDSGHVTFFALNENLLVVSRDVLADARGFLLREVFSWYTNRARA